MSATVIIGGMHFALITEIEAANNPVPTAQGTMTYRDWCLRECARINQKGGNPVGLLEWPGRCAVGRKVVG